MRTLLFVALLARAATAPILRDQHSNCQQWADSGECESNPGFMQKDCAQSCAADGDDAGGREACSKMVAAGACSTDPTVAITTCRKSCYKALRANLTEDQEGNCWYWGTDGECANNSVWMRKTCPRTCITLEAQP